jgi:hypothetical protein
VCGTGLYAEDAEAREGTPGLSIVYFSLCCFLSLTAFSFDFGEAFLDIVKCAAKFRCFLPQDIPLLS